MFTDWLRQWVRGGSRAGGPRQVRKRRGMRCRLWLEMLEDRTVPTSLVVGPTVDVTKLPGNEAESTISINPTNPLNVVEYDTISDFQGTGRPRFSMDGGSTWQNSNISTLPAGLGDVQTAWDNFGNLFLVRLRPGQSLDVDLSTNGGASFTSIGNPLFGSGFDQPSIAVGPGSTAGSGSVWVSAYNSSFLAVAAGASVSGLGIVSAWGTNAIAPGDGGHFGNIAVGPNGQVLVTYQTTAGDPGPANVFVNLDPDGLGSQGFNTTVTATSTNVGDFAPISAQPSRDIDTEANLAWDRSGGTHNGRVYLVYTDRPTTSSNDTDIFVRFSDDNGTTWSSRVRVNDDTTGNGKSQFNPAIAVDQTTGNVAVTWYDTRNSNAANNTTQVFGTASVNGGANWLPSVQISAGTSIASAVDPGFDYGDYDLMDFTGGVFYRSWADNSNSTGDNPDGTSALDIYTAKVTLITDNPTTTTVTSSINPSVFGQSVTFTATASSGAGVPTGSVTFSEGATVLASNVPVDLTGHASFSTASLGVGSHVISASFTGATGWQNSSGNVSQLVQDGTSTAVISSPNPSVFAQAVTFTATITAADAGAGVPAGTVTFKEGAAVLASGVAVNGSGQASFTISSLSVGNHTITATFSGATGWLTSNGNSAPQQVTAGTNTAVSSSPNPSVFGSPVTFTAAITTAIAGAGVPTGSVTFTEGATVLASGVAVDGSGHASFATSALNVGSHTITATFSGTNGWQGSSGNSAPQVVQNGTITAVASSPNPSSFGQSVTLTATVTATDSAAGVPTGSVTFKDGATILASGIVLDGTGHASFSSSALGVGSHTITASFTGTNNWQDSSGNTSQLVQDGTSTTVTSSPNPSVFAQAVTFTATITAADAGAGVPVGTVTFTEGATVLASGVTVNGSGQASFSTSTLVVGSHIITATFTGAAGWLASSGNSAPQQVTDGTSTTVSSSPNPSTFGSSVTFTATVTAANVGAGVPTGSVTFTEGATVLAANVTVDGSGHASFAIAPLSVGSHTITATFSGTNGWQGSSGAGTQLVQAGTNTAVASSPNPSPFGQSVTFTATVTAIDSSAGVPTGSVTFRDGATVLASGIVVDGSGQASFSTAALGVGSHTITASFTGTTGWQNSSGSAAPQIVQDGTSTALASSGSPAPFLQSVTFTATVTAADAGAGVPTGAVTFTEGATILAANVTVDSSGHAAFSTATLGVGTHNITATFTGTIGWGSSNGSVIQQIIEGTNTSVGSSIALVNFGQPVSFTATVAPVDPSAGTPTGTVTFTEGAAILAIVAVDNAGQASFTTSALNVGTHNITANFAGSNGFGDSSGVSPAVLVQEATTVAIVTAPNPSTFGQLVTFTATVTAVDAGAGVPTGAVTFMDGTTALATILVDGAGQATFTTGALGAGSHAITVAFAGTGGWLDSSNSTTQEVNKASTTTAVVSSDHPSVFGQFVTFTATVAAVAPGAGVPVGIVTFKDGATTIGAAILDGNGQATFTISSLLVGSHSITAVYGGGDNFIDSVSGSITQTVNKAATTTTMKTSVTTSKVGDPVTFTFRVVANAPSTGIPLGNVILKDNNNIVLATVPLDGAGKATFTSKLLSFGTHKFTAVYATNTNYLGSISPIITYNVTARGRR
ncbi:MAG: Ig-like domain repeat protein [Planctomycetes bacterium]|nr:Ig-like domain repeat protein [Planctomycetota bacterium]